MILSNAPWQNGTNESFNGKFRDECLAMNWFHSRAHAKLVIEVWRKHCNLIRPDSSLDYQIPAEFLDRWQKELTTEARVSR
jgi:putative transposase